MVSKELEDRLSKLEEEVSEGFDPKELFSLNEAAAENFIHKKLWKIASAAAFIFVAIQAVSVYVITDLAANRAESKAYADAYSAAFSNAVDSVSQAAVSAELAQISAATAEENLERLIFTAEAVVERAGDVEQLSSYAETIEQASTIVQERILSDPTLVASVLSEFLPAGTVLINLTSSVCPSGFIRAGDVGLDVADGGRLGQVLRDRGLYETRNIRDGDAALAQTDGVKVYACLRA